MRSSSIALIATAGVVALALTGCAGSAPSPEARSGASAEAVSVRGEFGETPRVEFPTPLTPEVTQCTEIIAGEGPHLVEGQRAMVGLAVYNGTTGEEIEVGGFDEDDPLPLDVTGSTLTGLAKGLTCGRDGSRVAIVIPAADAFGEQGNASLKVAPEDSLVVVADVHRSFPTRADGSPALTRDGFPAVVLAPDGRPGITVPKSDPPQKTEVEVLKQGGGQVVESGDQVVVQYTGVNWDTGKVFDSSWQKGAVAAFTVSDGEGSQVIPGFSKAIIGQKVGSQVGVIVAPVDGYGDQGSGQIPGGATLFFVVDILGVV